MHKLLSKTSVVIAILIVMTLSIGNVFAAGTALPANIQVAGQAADQAGKVTIKEGTAVNGLEKFTLSEAEKGLGEEKAAIPSGNKMSNVGVDAATDAVADAAGNHDPNNAINIDLDAIYSDLLTEEGQTNWYYVYVPTAGKLTAFMQTLPDPAIDYDLTLYTLNLSTGSLENPVFSQYGPGMNEQLSSIVQPGYYFVCISSYVGFDTVNPYYFVVKYSQAYDSAEPDDNIAQAHQKTGNFFTTSQTLDNEFDTDWMYLTLSAAKTLFLTLGNVPTGYTYKMDIFDANMNALGTLNQNATTSVNLQPGTYYFRVRSESGSGAGYTLTASQVANAVGSIYGHSPDWKYVLYTTPGGGLYVNDTSVNLNWERVYYFSYGGNYTQRTQGIDASVDKICGAGVFGSYSSSYTGGITNAFRIPVTNVLYTYFYSSFQSGGGYVQDWYDVTGMRTPRYTDSYDDTNYGPLYLIINADDGQAKDLFAELNFYYAYNYESASFSPR